MLKVTLKEPLCLLLVISVIVRLCAANTSGSTPDCRDYNGNTALMRACVKGHVACVSLLLAAGANVNIVNGAGKSALCSFVRMA